MKKLLGFLFLAAASFSGVAQEGFSKGSVYLTGDLGYSSISVPSGDEKYNEFSFRASAGYFVSENISVGLVAGVGITNYDEGVYDERESTFMVGGLGRYYFTPANRFSMLLELSALYVSNNYEETLSPDYKTNGFSAGFGPGINYFISNHFALHSYLGVIGFGVLKPDSGDAINTFNFNVGLNNLTFGLLYKLK